MHHQRSTQRLQTMEALCISFLLGISVLLVQDDSFKNPFMMQNSRSQETLHEDK